MKVFKEYSQNQLFLLPPSLDEFVPENHEVRIVNEVVDCLDMTSLLAKYEGGGAPAYHPAMILKVLVYAYSQGIYSSRKIACALKTDTSFMFLAGMQTPDFRTICIFRAEHSDVLPQLFVEVVRLCASLGMVGLGHIAFDGTKLKANASVRQSKDKDGLDKEIERIKEAVKGMIAASDKIDKLENEEYPDSDGSEIKKELRKKEFRLKKLQEAKEVLEREKLQKVNVTDPDNRLMKNFRKRIEPCYNGEVGVDSKDKVIVAAYVTQNESDNDEFVSLMEQVKRNLGKPPEESSADAGFSSYDNLEYIEENGLDVYMPDSLLETIEKGLDQKYDKSRFLYDETRDVYVCPAGEDLKRWQERKREGKPPLVLYRGHTCEQCRLKERCTSGKARSVSRDGREPLLEKMREKLMSEEGKEIYQKRMYTVEPVFGQMKWNGRKLAMDLRGLVKVQGEFLLMCMAHNVKKVIKRIRDGSVSLPKKHLTLKGGGLIQYS